MNKKNFLKLMIGKSITVLVQNDTEYQKLKDFLKKNFGIDGYINDSVKFIEIKSFPKTVEIDVIARKFPECGYPSDKHLSAKLFKLSSDYNTECFMEGEEAFAFGIMISTVREINYVDSIINFIKDESKNKDLSVEQYKNQLKLN